MLAHIRRTIGEYNFAGQYQQAPAPLGGGLVKAAWFRRYAPDELPPRFERIVQSWDTANKATELSDFSVCTSWGVAGKNLYLIDVLRRRMEYPELKRAVREQYERFEPSVVLIEDKASGTQLIQELIADGLHAVTRYRPQSDKIMRLHAQTAMIENGFVHLPEQAPWLAPYLAELTAFPNGKHDDQVELDRPNARLVQEGRPRAGHPRLLPDARANARARGGRLALPGLIGSWSSPGISAQAFLSNGRGGSESCGNSIVRDGDPMRPLCLHRSWSKVFSRTKLASRAVAT